MNSYNLQIEGTPQSSSYNVGGKRRSGAGTAGVNDKRHKYNDSQHESQGTLDSKRDESGSPSPDNNNKMHQIKAPLNPRLQPSIEPQTV